ncbi:hypothetical protein TWF730_005285 [Orbilia blumenaviensis]|uniref:G-patch domain-containing protein n=1 Tax=Orbilia blumenaviensis TaxID=1796055 RepID=A0AAV9VP42_9PEZI
MAYTTNATKRSRATFEKEDTSPYLIYGTAIPKPSAAAAAAGDNTNTNNVPIWKQEVVDERGRKRLHGAFMGGFSAGYFNTVGSKEGWTPSTFTSSRTNRAKFTALKPEDFMDDEDRVEAEAEEERRVQREAELAATAAASSSTGTTAEELTARGLDNTAKLFEMLGAVRGSVDEYPVGRKMMLKLGWREGTGVGPKVRRKVRDQEVGGIGGSGGAGGEEEEDFKTYLFLPEDVKIVEYPAKTDVKGLGYAGELKADGDGGGGDDGEGVMKALQKPKAATVLRKPNVRLGMGVGVFNDDGEDDEDIYEIKPKSAYNKVLGADKKKQQKQKSTAAAVTIATSGSGGAAAKPALKVPGRHVFVSKKNISKIRRCRDGTLPLPGFILQDEPFWDQSAKEFPLPEVPDGWIPKRLLADPAKYAAATTTTASTTVGKTANTAPLDIKARAALLGEEQRPGKSVFDFLTPAARERIASASGKKNLPQAKGEQVDTGKDALQKAKDAIPYLEKEVAENALKGFLPYADAPEKRARYRSFLEIKAGIRSGMPVRDKGVPLEDWGRELHEFAHAARIFKPVTGLMANRFTSSSSIASQLPTTGGSRNLEANEEELITRPSLAVKKEDPALEAAKMGMYGAMTRSVVQFFPTRLLCKRFNVVPPVNVDPDMGDEGMGGGGGGGKNVELVGKREMDRLMIEANTNADWRGARSVGFESAGRGGGGAGTGAGYSLYGDSGDQGGMHMGDEMEVDVGMEGKRDEDEKVDITHNPALEAPRAGDEVFKAIFGDDSEDED